MASAVAALPAITGRVTGTAFEGDATTVVPSAKLTLRSGVEPFARDIVVTAGATGTFDVQSSSTRPMPLAPMSIVGVHPEGGAIAPTVNAALSVDQPVVNVNVPFTGTTIIDVAVTRGIDGSVVPSGQLTGASVQASTSVNGYFRSKTLNAQGRVRFTGVPLNADGSVSFQITASHQQGSPLSSLPRSPHRPIRSTRRTCRRRAAW